MPRKVLSRRTSAASMSDEPEIEVPAAPQSDAPVSAKMNPFAVAILVIVLLAAGGLVVKNTMAAKQKSDKPAEEAKVAEPTGDDIQVTVSRVAKHIKVKADEVPTVATVQDADILRKNNPSFYQYAKNGDRLLIWSDKAILYSSTEDILLAVMPVTVNQAEAKAEAPSDTEQPAKETAAIEIRNGSGVAGLGKTLATKLKGLGLDVLTPGDAKSKQGYAKTIIMVSPGKTLPNTLKGLQEVTGAELVTVLPEDEPGLKGDVLIILGADKK